MSCSFSFSLHRRSCPDDTNRAVTPFDCFFIAIILGPRLLNPALPVPAFVSIPTIVFQFYFYLFFFYRSVLLSFFFFFKYSSSLFRASGGFLLRMGVLSNVPRHLYSTQFFLIAVGVAASDSRWGGTRGAPLSMTARNVSPYNHWLTPFFYFQLMILHTRALVTRCTLAVVTNGLGRTLWIQFIGVTDCSQVWRESEIPGSIRHLNNKAFHCWATPRGPWRWNSQPFDCRNVVAFCNKKSKTYKNKTQLL